MRATLGFAFAAGMTMAGLSACDASGEAQSTNACDRPIRVGLFLPNGEIRQLTDENSTEIPVGGIVTLSNVFGAAVDYGHFRVIVGVDEPLGSGEVSQERLEDGPIAIRVEGRCGPGAVCAFSDDVFDCR